jgi:hypothetical protein
MPLECPPFLTSVSIISVAILKVDSRHPTPFGHEMVASMLLKRLSTQLDPCAREDGKVDGESGSWFFGQEHIEYQMPKPTIALTKKSGDQMDGMAELTAIESNNAPVMIDLTTEVSKAAVVASNNFALAEDVPGKPGWIGTNIGDSMTIALPSVGDGLMYLGVRALSLSLLARQSNNTPLG